MKIFIDINHPAHVHYFRNFIRIMESKGHTFIITNRNYPIINRLLDFYKIDHSIRQARPTQKSKIRSILYLIESTAICIKKSFSYHPDLYLGFANSPCAITSFLFHKPSILLDDTEFNTTNHKIYKPFCSTLLTPFYFKLDLGKKQIRFNAFIEQLYLHNHYFRPSSSVLEELNLKEKEYVIIRYSAFDAHHDLAVRHVSDNVKKEIVKKISQRYRVIISFESIPIDDFYRPYIYSISPEKIHDLMAGARFIITEGITMASESFILGVPYIDINPLHVGYVDLQVEQYPEFAMQSTDESEIMQRIDFLMKTETDSSIILTSTKKMTIDPTQFLVWFVDNYPDSSLILKRDPKIQLNFK